MDEWLNWVGGAALVALGSALGWAGSFFTNRQAAKDAAQIRAELRETEREREAVAAAQARNQETRHALDELVGLTTDGMRDSATLLPNIVIRDEQFHRLFLRIWSRLADDPVLSELVARLTTVQERRLAYLRATDGEWSKVTPAIAAEWADLVTLFQGTEADIASEMGKRDWHW